MRFWRKPPAPPPPAFAPQVLRFDEMIFSFHQPLVCRVQTDEEGVRILYDDLELDAWGETQQEAEFALAVQFYTHYNKYALREVAQLNERGQRLKSKIELLLKHVFVEVRDSA